MRIRTLALPLLLVFAFDSVVGSATAGADRPDSQVDLPTVDERWSVPDDLTLRARVTRITPAAPTKIEWRHGGEGLGGEPTRGSLGELALDVGDWSPEVPVVSLVKDGKLPKVLFVTF